MSETPGVPKPFELLSDARFEIGGEDQLADLLSMHSKTPTDAESTRRLETEWIRLITDLHIRTGTLLKTDTLSFLLGAGASKECGGPLIGTVPLELERRLLDEGIADPEEASWLQCFYLAVRRVGGVGVALPAKREEFRQRQSEVADDAIAKLFPSTSRRCSACSTDGARRFRPWVADCASMVIRPSIFSPR